MYEIPRREGVTSVDESLVANGNTVTIRRALLHGQFDGAVVYVGGWRAGDYKTEAGATRRAVKAVADAQPGHHPNQPVRWYFASEPIFGESVAVITEVSGDKAGAAAGIYRGIDRLDGTLIHRFSNGTVGSVSLPEFYLFADQRNDDEEQW